MQEYLPIAPVWPYQPQDRITGASFKFQYYKSISISTSIWQKPIWFY